MKRFTFLLFLFLSLSTFAGDLAERIRELQSYTLVVALEAPEKSNLSKLKTDERPEYEKAIEDYNRQIREAATKFWTFNKNIEFKTWLEINALIKSKPENTLLLYSGNYSVVPSVNTLLMQRGLIFNKKVFETNEERDYASYYTSFNLCFPDELRKNKKIVLRTVAHLWPTEEDMIFAFQYIQCLLTETMTQNKSMDAFQVAKIYHNDLGKSKLFLKRSFIKSEMDMKYLYPYPSEVVGQDTLLQRILERENVVYVEITPLLIGTVEGYRLGYEHVLMNAQTGKIVAYLPVHIGVLHATGGMAEFHKYIEPDIFELYLRKEADKQDGPAEH